MTQTANKFTVKNIKTFTGREGSGYSCNLYLNNKKVAEVLDAADGAPLSIFWSGDSNVDITIRSYDFVKSQKYLTHKGTEAESIMEKMIMELPMKVLYEGLEPSYINSEIFIDDLINDTLTQQKISRLIKKEILVLDEKKIYSYKLKPNQDISIVKNHIIKTKPQQTVLNDKPMDELLEIFKQYS